MGRSERHSTYKNLQKRTSRSFAQAFSRLSMYVPLVLYLICIVVVSPPTVAYKPLTCVNHITKRENILDLRRNHVCIRSMRHFTTAKQQFIILVIALSILSIRSIDTSLVTLQAPNVGELKQQNEFTWETRNEVKSIYS